MDPRRRRSGLCLFEARDDNPRTRSSPTAAKGEHFPPNIFFGLRLGRVILFAESYRFYAVFIFLCDLTSCFAFDVHALPPLVSALPPLICFAVAAL
jgi:hypothetical protein